jgi:hypothetical protein
MRATILIAIAALFIIPIAIAQSAPPPADVDTAMFQKIDLEHKNTRQFFSDELSRQRLEFYNQFDERARYYETEFYDALNTAVYKLSLIWGAMVFVIVGLSNMLRISLESRRYKRLKETVKDELRVEMYLKNPPKPQAEQHTVFQQPHGTAAAYSYQMPSNMPTVKEGFFERRRKRKVAKQIERMQAKQAQEAAKDAARQAKAGTGITSPPQPPKAPQGGANAAYIAELTEAANREVYDKYLKAQGVDVVPAAPQQPKVEVFY